MGVMERRTDSGPDLGAYASALSQPGAMSGPYTAPAPAAAAAPTTDASGALVGPGGRRGYSIEQILAQLGVG